MGGLLGTLMGGLIGTLIGGLLGTLAGGPLGTLAGSPLCALMVSPLCALIGASLGAAICASLSTPIAILLETQIAGFIKDPHMRAQFGAATIGRYLFDTIWNTLEAGATACFGGILGAQAVSFGARVVVGTAWKFVAAMTSILSSGAVYMLKKYVAS
jgi:hypothetical protein